MTMVVQNVLLQACLVIVGISCVHSETIHYLPPSSPQAGLLELRVTDEKGESLPACVSLTDMQGNSLWGLDAESKVIRYRDEPRLWISGDTILCVTEGDYDLVVSRPFEYQSHSERVRVPAGGERTALDVTLPRVVNMNGHGWYAGDAHQHVVHGEMEYAVNVDTAARIAQAEGADWCFFDSAYSSVPGEDPSLEEVREQCRHVSNSRFLALVGDEYPKDHLGHMACLPGESKDWLTEIGQNEYEPAAGEKEALAHFEILRALREYGGISIYTHPLREYGGTEESPSNMARELPFDLLCAPDLVPSIDWMTDRPDDEQFMELWGRYLKRGHTVGICAFSDTCYDRRDARPLNKRTYVHLGEERPTQENIIRAIREGRTFGTSGPLLLVTLDGKVSGSTFEADGKPHELSVTAYSPGSLYSNRKERPGIVRCELYRFCREEGWFDKTDQKDIDTTPFEWNGTFPITENGNTAYVVRLVCEGENQVAISSPFYFRRKDFQPPEPVWAQAKFSLVDADDGKPLKGSIQFLEYGKEGWKGLETHPIGEEGLKMECSPLLRVRAYADGYEPQMKSLFFDSTDFYDRLIYPAQSEDLVRMEYYEKIMDSLQQLQLPFAMKRKP